MDTCLRELGGRTKTQKGFIETKLDPNRLSVVWSSVFSLLITQVSAQLTKWRQKNPTVSAASTLFIEFVDDVILNDVRVRDINQQRWSQLQAEGQKVTYDEFKLYARYVWKQWARNKSKGIKRTKDAINASPPSDGKSVPPTSASSIPRKEPTTPRKRVKSVEQQVLTPLPSTQKSAGNHVNKKRRVLAIEPLKDLIHMYMSNGYARGSELKSYITEIETELAREPSTDDASDDFHQGIFVCF